MDALDQFLLNSIFFTLDSPLKKIKNSGTGETTAVIMTSYNSFMVFNASFSCKSI